jgi:hypothetical protein
MFNFLSGIITMGFLTGGLFFLKFWTRTGDWLFASFAAAFWLLALNQLLLVAANIAEEEKTWLYLLRLAAFLVIAVAVAVKNRR